MPRGRPPGSTNKKKAVAPKKPEKEKYPCLHCTYEKTEDQFYTARYSNRWNYSNGKALYCKECVDKMLKEYSNRYGEQTATAIMCAALDIPFYVVTYQSIIENNSFFTMGLYIRVLNGGQFRHKTFLNSIIENEFTKTNEEVKEIIESKWGKQDKQNMNYCLSVIGYDPFNEMGMTNNDRKHCFNILAGYCDDDSVKHDSHKIQCVIQLTHLHLQCKKLDESINKELADIHVDDKRVGDLTSSKKQLIDSISKISKDNNIASNYNENSKKGADTLSDKMKEMAANDFEAIKVNLFDIKTSEAMKQIADLSHRSILDQLNFDANDYTEMIKEQREMILKFEEERDVLREENRLLNNEIEDMKEKKKR